MYVYIYSMPAASKACQQLVKHVSSCMFSQLASAPALQALARELACIYLACQQLVKHVSS